MELASTRGNLEVKSVTSRNRNDDGTSPFLRNTGIKHGCTFGSEAPELAADGTDLPYGK